MKAKRSLLVLKDFYITSYSYRFEQPTGKMEVEKWFDGYDIDINFGIRDLEDNLHQVALKVLVNTEKQPLPGYVIEAECIGIFFLDSEKVNDEVKQNLLVRSALLMNINYLRTFVAGNTAHYPLGKYWLPSVNVPDLINRKSLETQAEENEEEKVTTVKRKRKTKNETKSKA